MWLLNAPLMALGVLAATASDPEVVDMSQFDPFETGAVWRLDVPDSYDVVGNRVRCDAIPRESTSFNAMWTDGVSASGRYGWRFTVEEGEGVRLGLTTAEKFAAGWKCRGLLYNGNLADGVGLLRSAFGPAPSRGDRVDVVVDLEPESLEVYFILNEKSLGLAFNLTAPYPTPLYPLVGFSQCGGTAVSIRRLLPDEMPGNLRRLRTIPKGLNGRWRLIGHPVIPVDLELVSEEEGEQVQATVRVVNTLNFRLERDSSSGSWHSGPGMSTMMIGPLESMEVEKNVADFFENLVDLERERGQIVAINKDGQFMRFEPYDPSIVPVTENPLLETEIRVASPHVVAA